MYKFTIDRSEWLNGNVMLYYKEMYDDNIQSNLYNPDIERKCCLGILISPYFEDEYLENVEAPLGTISRYTSKNSEFELYEKMKDIPEEVSCVFSYDISEADYIPIKEHIPIVKELMRFNDDTLLSKEHRENLITKAFAKMDIEVEFVGEYNLEEIV